jgi:pyruvate formate lyase activating enzyme
MAVAIFKEAKAAGLATAFVSNGNGTPQVLQYLRPWVDLYKVDLKSFDERHYHQLGGRLQPILETIRRLYEMGFWLEIVTLAIPGFNDSDDELTRLAEFLASVSPDVPWHVTAFHKDYKMTDPDDTSPETLMRAAQIGRKAGLRYIYAGNLPGAVGDLENTRCPDCHELLVKRFGYLITDYRLTPDGRCQFQVAPVLSLRFRYRVFGRLRPARRCRGEESKVLPHLRVIRWTAILDTGGRSELALRHPRA